MIIVNFKGCTWRKRRLGIEISSHSVAGKQQQHLWVLAGVGLALMKTLQSIIRMQEIKILLELGIAKRGFVSL